MTHSLKVSFNPILSIAVVALGMAIASPILQASAASTPQTVAQASSPPKPSNGPKIVLTELQKTTISAIQKDESSQILAVLTPEQQAIIQKASQSGNNAKTVEADLKLTPAQQQKIALIQQQSIKQIKAVLTPEQLQILKNQTPR